MGFKASNTPGAALVRDSTSNLPDLKFSARSGFPARMASKTVCHATRSIICRDFLSESDESLFLARAKLSASHLFENRFAPALVLRINHESTSGVAAKFSASETGF